MYMRTVAREQLAAGLSTKLKGRTHARITEPRVPGQLYILILVKHCRG